MGLLEFQTLHPLEGRFQAACQTEASGEREAAEVKVEAALLIEFVVAVVSAQHGELIEIGEQGKVQDERPPET